MSEAARQRFLAAAENENTAGAYLLIAPRPGVGKHLADEFLRRLFCRHGGCGTCVDCLKVANGHVDILRLCAPRIDDFREAISFIAQKPYEAAHKAIVIENADDMTEPAANSMLKTLEQLPPDTVMLLLARSAQTLLPTVVSRCAVVYLPPDPDAQRGIVSALGVDAATAHILCDLSGGYIDEARRIFADGAFWPLRDTMLRHAKSLLFQRGMAISVYADFLEANKDRIFELLGVMQTYYRDILVYKKTKNDAMILNRDRAGGITEAALHFTSGAISNMIKVILNAERRFFFPVNFRLAAEKMFFDILEEKDRWKK